MLDWLFGAGDAEDTIAREDAKQSALIAEQVRKGQMTPTQAAALEAHRLDQGPVGLGPGVTADDEILDGLKEGAAEGLAAEQSWFKKTVNGITAGALGFIPWWFWIVAAVALFFYLGGGIFIKRKLANG